MDVEEGCEMVTSMQDVAVVWINLQQLWLLARPLRKCNTWSPAGDTQQDLVSKQREKEEQNTCMYQRM